MTVQLVLIVILLVLLLVWLRMTLLPDRVGTVVAIGGIVACAEGDSTNCARQTVAGSAVKLSVDLGDETVDAECSGCVLCMGDLRKGYPVGVTRIGSRLIAQPLLFPSLQKRWMS
ncbi:MAG: hypothetical protein QGG50_03095 [Methanopyri archaeon]|jgi:hypothetical protein|nr:hypothetical protein [Methanopyri archaeon]|tara:strand:- start:82 stop:426 length:345 start_codon:yes stop_codon:yes gene_type:complete